MSEITVKFGGLSMYNNLEGTCGRNDIDFSVVCPIEFP